MIEINLIPDVKQELIRAKHVRTMVVSGAVIVGIVSVGIVVLLAAYLFGVQTLRSGLADSATKEKFGKLQDVPDLANMLTIQSQLSNIKEQHDGKNIDSRLFDLLTAINPSAPNEVIYTQVKVDSENGVIHVDAQAANGFVAADVFKKTVLGTSLTYGDGDNAKTEKLTTDVALTDTSYGEDTTGKKVLRFSVEFAYSEALFANGSSDLVVSRPDRQNATDSFKHLPESLFGTRVDDTEEAEE